MSDTTETIIVVLLGVAALGIVALAATAIFVIVKYRLPVRGIAATLAGLAYVLSPVDAVPEVPLGPVGLVDDIAVLVAAAMYIGRLVQARKAQELGPYPDSALEPPTPPRKRHPR